MGGKNSGRKPKGSVKSKGSSKPKVTHNPKKH